MKYAYRMISWREPQDDFRENEKLVNIGTGASEPRWPTHVDNQSMKFIQNTYIGDGTLGLDLTFAGTFTVTFWAKFPVSSLGTAFASDVMFFVVFEGGTTVKYILPSTDNNWHYYTVSRDSSNLVVLRIDGVTVESQTVASTLNLDNNSYIGLGNHRGNFDGYDVIVDDVVILNRNSAIAFIE